MLKQCSDITFMALCLWREARGETVECRIAIAYVIMNRALHPSWWGGDIITVLFKPMQFSSLTDPKDRQLTTWPVTKNVEWYECLEIANNVICGNSHNPIEDATHYYDVSIQPPGWATEDKFVKQIGKIKFYRG